mgnify:CR=1 FL=1
MSEGVHGFRVSLIESVVFGEGVFLFGGGDVECVG